MFLELILALLLKRVQFVKDSNEQSFKSLSHLNRKVVMFLETDI